MEHTLIRFIITGLINTGISFTLIYFFLNLLHLNYWLSTFSGNFISFLLAFFLGKAFTFRNKDGILPTFIKFTINFIIIYGVCYLFSYGITYLFIKEITLYNHQHLENIAALIGFVLFPIGNFIGQKQFVFKNRREGEKNE